MEEHYIYIKYDLFWKYIFEIININCKRIVERTYGNKDSTKFAK